MRELPGMRVWFASRRSLIAQRPWTPAERRVVWQGLIGRAMIALEPVLCSLLFAGLAFGVAWRAHHVPGAGSIIVLVPVFMLGFCAFAVYAVVLLVAPLRAYAQTFRPIYIVDGYLRHRTRDAHSSEGSGGYVAVLCEDRRAACEWESFGPPLSERTVPALIEFSRYAGIHKIDGKSTGLLPERMPTFGVGVAARR